MVSATAAAFAIILAGVSAGVFLQVAAHRHVRENGAVVPAEVEGLRRVLMAMPLIALLFVVVIFAIDDGQSGTGPWEFLVPMALVAGAVAIVQGLVFARGLPLMVQEPTSGGRVLTLGVLPETALLFQFMGTFLVLGSAGDASYSLWVLAGGAVVTVTGQALATSGEAFERGVRDLSRLPALLVRFVAPEVAVLGAFIWFFLQMPGGTA